MEAPDRRVVARAPHDRPISNPEHPRARLVRRNATECSVRSLLPALGLDELRVVETVVSRLVAARADYGELNLDSDPRDWRIEGAAEMADFLFYAAAREVSANDRRLERLRCEAADEMAGRIDVGLRELRDSAPVPPQDWPGPFELGEEHF